MTQDGCVDELWHEVVDRLRPDPSWLELGVPQAWLVAAVGLGLALVALPGVWRLVRVGVTIVHELGHGLVGMLFGRSFTGLVLRPDMSGHAVTRGPSHGVGYVVMTWAGYPAPGVVGACLLHAGAAGWAPPVLGVALVGMLLGLLRSRSVYTVLVVLLLIGATAALWWAGPPDVQVLVLTAVGTMLLLGSWRHLLAVIAHPAPGSDPQALARLTRVPAGLWLLSVVVVLGLATWWAATPLLPLLGR